MLSYFLLLTPYVLLLLSMVLLMNLLQTLVCEVRIDLRCGDTRVTEHLLHRADIGTVFEELGGERMPERVGGHLLHDTCRGRDVPYDAFDRLRFEPTFLTVERL